MAGPITHIVLSDLIFNTHFSNKDKKQFYVGTSFPDIRYTGVIEREKTHFAALTIKELQALPAFEAGLKFHSLVDVKREEFMKSQHVYELLPESPYITQALKFYEDKLLYAHRSNWEEIGEYLENVLPEEAAFGIDENSIRTWHRFLIQYMQTPSDQSIRYFVKAVNRPSEMAEEMIALNEEMATNPLIQSTVHAFYNSFPSQLT